MIFLVLTKGEKRKTCLVNHVARCAELARLAEKLNLSLPEV